MKLGVGIGPLGPPGGASVIEFAKEAEALGYTRTLRYAAQWLEPATDPQLDDEPPVVRSRPTVD